MANYALQRAIIGGRASEIDQELDARDANLLAEVLSEVGTVAESSIELTSPAQSDTLYYDTASAKFKNKPPIVVDFLDFGAVADGTTDNSAALVAAIESLGSTGGTIHVPRGVFAFAGNVTFPSGVNLWGAGSGRLDVGTVFKCLSANSCLQFGSTTEGSYGGHSGNFTIDGNGFATDPCIVGIREGAYFDSIEIIDAAQGAALTSSTGGSAMTLSGTQNSAFHNIKLQGNAGHGLTFTNGAGSNEFFTLGIPDASGYAVRFISTVFTPAIGVAYPIANRVNGFLIESYTNSTLGHVYHGSGTMNGFSNGTFSFAGITTAKNYITVRQDDNTLAQPSTGLLFDNVWWGGSPNAVETLFDLAQHTTMNLEGRHVVKGANRIFYAANGSSVYDNSHRLELDVTTRFVSPTGTAFAEQAIVQRVSHAATIVRRTAATDKAFIAGTNSADNWYIDANGAMVWHDTTTLYDQSPGNWFALTTGLNVSKALWSSALITKTFANNNTSISTNDQLVLLDASSGSFTIRPHTAVGFSGKLVYFKKIDSSTSTVTITATGSETIEGQTTYKLIGKDDFVVLASDGTNWRVIAHRPFRRVHGAQGINIIGGFGGNTIDSPADASTIGGGGIIGSEQRILAGGYNTIAGGYDDQITSTGIGASTISGGAHHRIADTATHATIGGGSFGLINGTSDYATIGGGTVNSILGADQSTIGGGAQNLILSDTGTIAGGVGNVIASLRGTVGGGFANVATGNGASIAGGDDNATKGTEATIAGGLLNRVGPVRMFIDGSVTGESTTVSVPSGDFTAGDIGATVYIQGCGVNFGVHTSTITAVASTTSITVAAAPPQTRAGVTVTVIGTAAGADTATVGGGLRNLADGAQSVVAGGRENKATLSYAAVTGGFQNAATQAWAAVGGGDRNVAAGAATFVGGGTQNTATPNNSTISGGKENAISAGILTTIGGGFQNTISADYGTIPGGRGNTVTAVHGRASGYEAKADIYGQSAQASGKFAVVGDAQTSVIIVRRQVLNTAAHTLLADNSLQRLNIPDDTTWAFSVLIVARRVDADNESAAYKIEGCIDRNAGTVALVGTITKTVLGEDTAAWDCNAIADDANKALGITFSGEVGKTINVVGRVTLVQLTCSKRSITMLLFKDSTCGLYVIG